MVPSIVGSKLNQTGEDIFTSCNSDFVFSRRTIQDALENRLSNLFGGLVRVAASGRTDAGVHARSMIFHFELPSEIDPRRRSAPHLAKVIHLSDDIIADVLLKTLSGVSANSGLPSDIQVVDIRPAPVGFHARDSCIGKRYSYTIQEGCGSPMTSRFRWALGPGKVVDIIRMSEAAAELTGIRDFSSFATMSPTDPRTPVKQMRLLEVHRSPSIVSERNAALPLTYSASESQSDSQGCVKITAECDRFLHHMMRIICGTLVQVGLGRLTVADIVKLRDAGHRSAVALAGGPRVYMAPAHGLCLEQCYIKEDATACSTWMHFGRRKTVEQSPVIRTEVPASRPNILTLTSNPVKPPFPAEIVQVLNASHLCYLSTCNEKGYPHLSLMTFTYHQPDEVLIFSTRKDTKKSSNFFTSGGHVAILVHDFPSKFAGNFSSSNEELLKCTYSITLNGLARIEEGERAEKYRAFHLAHNPRRSQNCCILALISKYSYTFDIYLTLRLVLCSLLARISTLLRWKSAMPASGTVARLNGWFCSSILCFKTKNCHTD
jgi:tRNA pseudouridine38-40 synthase